MRTITATMSVWLGTDSEYRMADFSSGDPVRMVDAVSFFVPSFASGKNSTGSYIRIGQAEITVTIDDDKDLAPRAVEGLRAKQAEIRAKAEKECMGIQESIDRMLALAYEPADV